MFSVSHGKTVGQIMVIEKWPELGTGQNWVILPYKTHALDVT